VYVTGGDLEKSFVFENIVEITSHMHALSDSCVNVVDNINTI